MENKKEKYFTAYWSVSQGNHFMPCEARENVATKIFLFTFFSFWFEEVHLDPGEKIDLLEYNNLGRED